MNASALALLVFLAAPPSATSAKTPETVVPAQSAPTASPSSALVTVETIQRATADLMATFQKVKRDDGTLSAQDKSDNDKAYAQLDEILDRTHFSQEVIAHRRDKLTQEELAQFAQRFWTVVQRSSYPGAGEFFRKNPVKLAAPVEVNGQWTHVVTATVPSEGIETEISFKWQLSSGRLRVVDVLFDGDSLVKDYQNQFARIVDKEGGPGLIKKLDDRAAALLQTSGREK